MQSEELFAMVFILGMISGVFIIVMAMRQRSHQLELQHREKMAMIERGLTPLHEAPFVHTLIAGATARPGHMPSRSLSLGIVVVALGLGLMSIISIAGGSPAVGVGIGGAITIVGIAFIVNGIVTRQWAPAQHQGVPPPPNDRPLA